MSESSHSLRFLRVHALSGYVPDFRYDRFLPNIRVSVGWYGFATTGNVSITADQSDAQGVEAFLERPIF
jgi:hypothetical protein